MRRLLLVMAALSALPAAAQWTVSRADIEARLASTGTAATFDLDGLAGAEALRALAERTGGGRTWDLTAVRWVEGSAGLFARASPPVPGSEIAALQAATHVSVITQDGDEAFSFAVVGADAFDALGATARGWDEHGQPMTTGVLFSPAKRVFPLPLTATSVWSSAYDLEVLPGLDGLAFAVAEAAAVEGWGTLVTPSGSAEVLKVRTRSVITTTVEVPDQPPVVSRDTSFTVEFVSPLGSEAAIDLDAAGEVIGASWTRLSASGGTAGEPGPAATGALALALRSATPARRGRPVEVAFALAAPAELRVDVFNALGRRVRAEAPRALGAGHQNATIATAGFPAGAYLVRFEAGAQRATLQLLVVE